MYIADTLSECVISHISNNEAQIGHCIVIHIQQPLSSSKDHLVHRRHQQYLHMWTQRCEVQLHHMTVT